LNIKYGCKFQRYRNSFVFRACIPMFMIYSALREKRLRLCWMIYATCCPNTDLIMLLSFRRSDITVYNFSVCDGNRGSLHITGAFLFMTLTRSRRLTIIARSGREAGEEAAIVSRSNSNKVLPCKNGFCNISVGDLRFNLALTTSRRQARLMARPRPIASMKRGAQKLFSRGFITVDKANIPDLLLPGIQSKSQIWPRWNNF